MERTDTANVAQDADVGISTKRISWGAILAGSVVIVVLQLVLGLLGVGIGAGTVDPLEEHNPVHGIGVGAGIWILVSSLLALFVGGWVAGRLAGVPRKLDGVLHGVVTWGTATLLTLYLLGTAAGALLGGAAMTLGRGTRLLSAYATTTMERSGGKPDIDWTALRSDVQRTASRPQTKAAPARERGTTGQDDTATVSAVGAVDLLALADRVLADGDFSADDRQAFVDALMAGGMSVDEARRTVGRWESSFGEARAAWERNRAAAEQRAREIGDAAARGLSRAAWWSFFALLLGAVAAAMGGFAGVPQERLSTTAPPGVTPIPPLRPQTSA